MADSFGAPVIDPAGNARSSSSPTVGSGTQVARNRADELVHVRGRSRPRATRRPATVPTSHTRDRSLRIRSTIMTFSARSFSLASSSRASAASCFGVGAARPGPLDRPRAHDPSRDAEELLGARAQQAHSPDAHEAAVVCGTRGAQAGVDRGGGFGCLDLEPRRQAQLVRVARADRVVAARDQRLVLARGVA